MNEDFTVYWRQRVREELSQLTERHDKLDAFLRTQRYTELNKKHQKLLKKQHQVMYGYICILRERLELGKDDGLTMLQAR